jgi:glucose/arabinose dehydrogenase
MRRLTSMILLALAITGCGESSRVPVNLETGASPRIPPPTKVLIPTVHIAPAKGWPEGRTPQAAPGFAVNAFATGFQHPRWLYVLPNGDVLVAETNGPEGKSGITGLKGAAMKRVMARAGAGVPSANRITLLRDADGDGRAEIKQVFLDGLSSPFGMALIGDQFYVANHDHLVRATYTPGALHIEGKPARVGDLPGGGRYNHHWTKSLLASPDGRWLFVGVGSNSNVAENGMEVEKNRAVILQIDPRTGASQVYASGLRNPVGLAWNPGTNDLWAVANERDELGSDLVPDIFTSVKPGGFYGWPYSYWGQHVDSRVQPQRPDLVAKAIVPDYALGSHAAPLGLAFYQGSALPARYQGGAFICLHGSWNRRPWNGYRLAFVPFANGRPAGALQTILDGFIDRDGKAMGRPTGVAVDADGALLVADDVGNTVWRVSASGAPGAAAQR